MKATASRRRVPSDIARAVRELTPARPAGSWPAPPGSSKAAAINGRPGTSARDDGQAVVEAAAAEAGEVVRARRTGRRPVGEDRRAAHAASAWADSSSRGTNVMMARLSSRNVAALAASTSSAPTAR